MSVKKSITAQTAQIFTLLLFGLASFFVLIDFLEKSSRGSHSFSTLCTYEIVRLFPLALSILPLTWALTFLLLAYSLRTKGYFSILSIIGASGKDIMRSLLSAPLILTALLFCIHATVTPQLEQYTKHYRALLSKNTPDISEDRNVWSVRTIDGHTHILNIARISQKRECFDIRYIHIQPNALPLRISAPRGTLAGNTITLSNAHVISQSGHSTQQEYELIDLPNSADLYKKAQQSTLFSLIVEVSQSEEARIQLISYLQPFLEAIIIIGISLLIIVNYLFSSSLFLLLSSVYPIIAGIKLIFNL